MEQNHTVFEVRRHLGRIGDKVRAEIATIELHTFDNFGFCLQTFVFFDGDDALIADFGHCVCDLLADCGLAIGRNGADFCNFSAVAHGTRHCFNLGDDRRDGFVDAALQIHRVHASGNRFHPFFDDCLGQHSRCGRAVTGLVIGSRGYVFDKLCAHVFKVISKLDFLSNRDTVFGDAGRAVGFIDDHVSALRTKCDLNSIGEDIYALEHTVTGIHAKFYVF